MNGAFLGFALLVVIGLIMAVAFMVSLYRWRKGDSGLRGFQVQVKPASGSSPEQREREAHNG